MDLNLLFKILLTINATSWMLVVYWIKESVTVWQIPQWLFALILLCIPVVLSIISIWLVEFLGSDSLNGCQEFGLADNEFLPTYMGYFFLSLGVEDQITLMYMYLIVFAFTFLSQTQYYNPIFLLFGYHYYHIVTECGTRVFIITKGKVLRNKNSISFDNLKRINDSTYIQKKGE